MAKPSIVKIEIAPKTIFYIFATGFLIWFLWQIKAIIFIFFISFILASALSPIVDFLVAHKLPRGLSVLLIYLTFILLLAILVGSVIPPVVSQTRDLISSLPLLLGEAVFDSYSQNITNFLSQEFARVSGKALRVTVSLATGIFSIFTVLVITFYFLLDKSQFYQNLVGLAPLVYQERIKKGIFRVERKLGSWVRGQAFLATAVGLAVYLGLTVLGVGFTIPLAIIAGILECVPTIGPIISAIPAMIVASTVSPIQALLVAGLYTLIQQLENNFLVPQVMKKAVGINPLVTIIALLVGGRMLGLVGAVLAVPIVGVVMIVGEEVMRAVYDAAD